MFPRTQNVKVDLNNTNETLRVKHFKFLTFQ